jgi:hypothetical protein
MLTTNKITKKLPVRIADIIFNLPTTVNWNDHSEDNNSIDTFENWTIETKYDKEATRRNNSSNF